MPDLAKARVFISGRSQAVQILAEFRFTADEVYIRRDPQTGDIILSQAPHTWEEIYAALDAAGVPDDFLEERLQDAAQTREEL